MGDEDEMKSHEWGQCSLFSALCCVRAQWEDGSWPSGSQPLSLTSSLHNCEQYMFVVYKPPSLWDFVIAAKRTKTDSSRIIIQTHVRSHLGYNLPDENCICKEHYKDRYLMRRAHTILSSDHFRLIGKGSPEEARSWIRAEEWAGVTKSIRE